MKRIVVSTSFVVGIVAMAMTIFSQQEGQRRMGFGPGPGSPDLKLVKQFDVNNDGWLNTEERAAARNALPELQKAAREKMGSERTRFGEPPAGELPGGQPREANLGRDKDRPMNDKAKGDEKERPRDGLPPGPPDGPRGFGPPDGPPGFVPLDGLPGFGPPGGPGGMARNREPAQKGPMVSVDSVTKYPDHELYDPKILRTIFINFEDKENWEAELADFKNTDVEVPAEIIVDGQTYPNVGLKFRGNSSFQMTPATYKRSLNLSMDLVNADQRLYGYKTLNLLNAAGDPSFISAPVYAAIALRFTPAPKANLVKVVINGESWGIFANVQQFNKDFLDENLGISKGARWKVPGRPNGDGGLRYKGDEVSAYKTTFEIKTADNEESWAALINLCKVLNETPTDELPAAIEPLLDVDGALWFLANDIATVNSDGYWTRASDYNVYLDPNGKFHLYPYDMNEAFIAGHGPPGGGRGGRRGPPGEGPPPGQPAPGDGKRGDEAPRGDRPPEGERAQEFRRPFGPGGPGGPGGPRGPGGGPELDPLIGLDDQSKPLRSRLLAVPKYREQYLQNIRSIAEFGMAPEFIEPMIDEFVGLIKDEVQADTKKLSTVEAFEKAVAKKTEQDGATDNATTEGPEKAKPEKGDSPKAASGRPIQRVESIREFFAARRKYLLQHKEITNLPGPPQPPTERVDMRKKQN
jgi:spore coat protein CotH